MSVFFYVVGILALLIAALLALDGFSMNVTAEGATIYGPRVANLHAMHIQGLKIQCGGIMLIVSAIFITGGAIVEKLTKKVPAE